MKSSLISLFIIPFLVSMEGCITQEASGRREIPGFNNDWSSVRDLPGNNYAGDTSFHSVTLPHIPKIESLIVNNQWMRTCWYKKTFTIDSSQKGKKHFLYLEGVMQNADIYPNGKHIFSHTGGCLPFVLPFNNGLFCGKPNLVAIKPVNTDDTLVLPGMKKVSI